MKFTFVTRCRCGCDTFSVIIVTATDAQSALASLEEEWARDDKHVDVVAAFNGEPQIADVPVWTPESEWRRFLEAEPEANHGKSCR